MYFLCWDKLSCFISSDNSNKYEGWKKGRDGGREERREKMEVLDFDFFQYPLTTHPTLIECLTSGRPCVWLPPRRTVDEATPENHTGGSGLVHHCIWEILPEIETHGISLCCWSFFINPHWFICSVLETIVRCSPPSNKIKLISSRHLKIYLCMFFPIKRDNNVMFQ